MLNNLELMKMRAQASINDRQHNRMIMDRLRSFHRALLYSYQSSYVKKDNDKNAHYVYALMNPDRVKFDYDEKIISIEWEHGFKPGDTFEWGKNTNSHWIILKPEMTELAYLRANCRRCKLLTAVDPETHISYSQWAAIRGPVETKIEKVQKSNLIAHVPNLTLEIYMGDTEQNRRTFERYKRFKFDDRYWKVQAPDFISTPGVFDITAEEDYECAEDEMFLEIVETEFVDPIAADENEIIGPNSIKPFETVYFYLKNKEANDWTLSLPASKNKEIDDILTYSIIGDRFKVCWEGSLSGSFIVSCAGLTKTVLVESLF